MQTEDKKDDVVQEIVGEAQDTEALELVLFQVSECYVYMIRPRKSAASYRPDEWDVNKWAWDGVLKVISKGEECIIRLEDKKTGELFAWAFLRHGEAHPVEPVIDSSRYFVLRIEENLGGRLRHAFIGIGFRERTEAYDFQAALHDHMKYLNKKKTAEEMEQQHKQSSSVDYSLKDGETLVLQVKNETLDVLSLQALNSNSEGKGDGKVFVHNVKLPPPPPSPLSPVAVSPRIPPTSLSLENTCIEKTNKTDSEVQDFQSSPKDQNAEDVPDDDDDFGDFQAAGYMIVVDYVPQNDDLVIR